MKRYQVAYIRRRLCEFQRNKKRKEMDEVRWIMVHFSVSRARAEEMIKQARKVKDPKPCKRS